MSILSLKNQAAFDKINKKGQRFRSPYYTIVILKTHVMPSLREALATQQSQEIADAEVCNDECVSLRGSASDRSNDVVTEACNDNSSPPPSTSLPLQISLGMKVSRKLGNAVVRNKIKRRVRHLIRIIHDYYNLSSIDASLSIIFIPKKNFELIEFATLTSAVLSTLKS